MKFAFNFFVSIRLLMDAGGGGGGGGGGRKALHACVARLFPCVFGMRVLPCILDWRQWGIGIPFGVLHVGKLS